MPTRPIPPDDPGDHGKGSSGGGASEATLLAILAELNVIDTHVDGLEACCAANNALLTNIDANTSSTTVSLNTIQSAFYAEDTQHATGNLGVFALAVRNDAAATSRTNADGDYSPVSVDEFGRVFVTGTVSTTVTSVVSAFTHGQNTDIDSGANEQVVVASNPATEGVLIKAHPNNTGIVYVGGIGVSAANGYPLEAGETITLPVDNANKVYAIADTDNQDLAWMAT